MDGFIFFYGEEATKGFLIEHNANSCSVILVKREPLEIGSIAGSEKSKNMKTCFCTDFFNPKHDALANHKKM